MPAGTSRHHITASEHRTADAVLRRFFGYRLKRAYHAVRSDLLEQLEPLGLRITTFSTLCLVTERPGLRQSELAAALDMKRSNMVSVVDDLERRGWVTRQVVPSDRRAFALYPTSSGRKQYERSVDVVSEHDAQVFQCLDDDELKCLKLLLERIESPR